MNITEKPWPSSQNLKVLWNIEVNSISQFSTTSMLNFTSKEIFWVENRNKNNIGHGNIESLSGRKFVSCLKAFLAYSVINIT